MEVKMQLLALLVSAIVIGSSDAITCYSSYCTAQTCGAGDWTTSGCTSCQLITSSYSYSFLGVTSTTYSRSCLMLTQMSTGCSTTEFFGTTTTCYCNTDYCNANQNTVQPTPAPRNTATPLTATTGATVALFTLSTALILSL